MPFTYFIPEESEERRRQRQQMLRKFNEILNERREYYRNNNIRGVGLYEQLYSFGWNTETPNPNPFINEIKKKYT